MARKANHRCNLVSSHLIQTPTNVKTLCFLDAFNARKSGSIFWGEYLRHLLIHLTGVRHKEDNRGHIAGLRRTDPFGFEIFSWSQQLKQKITDIAPLEAVFQAYRSGSVEGTRDRLAALDEEHVKQMRGSVALLALQERDAKMLEMCLNLKGGFPFEAYFIEEADSVEENKDPETFQVLEQSRYRKLFPREPPQSGKNDDPAAVFDIGGKLPVDW